MLTLNIPEDECFDEVTGKFSTRKAVTMQLEHSLISVKRWEQKYNKPFLGSSNKRTEHTPEEMYDYIKCMTINNVDPAAYNRLSQEQWNEVISYIKAPMTATWFSNNNMLGAAKNGNEIITAEIIYYWMIMLNIPEDFQKWHLNSLLTLIKVVSLKQQPKKKMSEKDAAAQRKAQNKALRAKYHSKG